MRPSEVRETAARWAGFEQLPGLWWWVLDERGVIRWSAGGPGDLPAPGSPTGTGGAAPGAPSASGHVRGPGVPTACRGGLLGATTIAEMVHPADRERARCALEQVTNGGTVTGLVLRVTDFEGGWRRVRWSFCRIAPGPAASAPTWPAGMSVVAVGRDVPGLWTAPVSEREGGDEGLSAVEVLDRARTLEAILCSWPDVVTIFDGQMQLVQDGAAATALLGVDTPLSVSESLARVHDEDRSRVVDAFDDVLSGVRREVTVRYRLRHADGRWITVDSTARTDLDDGGQVSAVVVVTRDVSEILATEARLRAALAEAEQTGRAHGELLSRVSHELRTPLNSILGFAQLLQMEVLPAHQTILVERVLRAGRRLLALVDEVLAVARLDAGHVELDASEVDAVDVLTEVACVTGAVVEGTGAPGEGVDQGASRSRDVMVWADRRWLRHVLTSMVDVARQSVGGGVEHPVVLSAEQGSSNWVQLSILPAPAEDGGSPDGPPATLAGTGAGIGFARCHYLVEQMGGRLQQAADGHGFELWVTRAGPSSSASDQRSSSPRGEHRQALTVLVVSDDHDVVELVDQLVERRADVSARVVGMASWSAVVPGSGAPDVIVFDATSNGTLDVAAALASVREADSATHRHSSGDEQPPRSTLSGEREREGFWHVGGGSAPPAPAVLAVLVREAQVDAVEAYLAAGADACLGKPVDFRTFVELIDAAQVIVPGPAGVVGAPEPDPQAAASASGPRQQPGG